VLKMMQQIMMMMTLNQQSLMRMKIEVK
jgi:hypothetical protein